MAKRTGLANSLFVDGYDLSGDINSVGSMGGGFSPIDMTDITQSAMDRLSGVRDGHMDIVSYLNNTALTTAHARFKGVSTSSADQILTYCAGSTIGDPVGCLTAKQASYDGTRDTNGGLLFNTKGQASGGTGFEWQELLTAGKITQGAAAAVTSYDFTAATAFGLQAFLHVFAFTGTSATVNIQESSDNGGADAWANVVGGGFTAVTAAPQAQRIQTTRALAVKRYLRILTTGVFTNLVFAVTVAKNVTAVTF
jgi:hypothetical protein